MVYIFWIFYSNYLLIYVFLFSFIIITFIFQARNETRGRNAVKELEKEGLHPKFHLLDISSLESIKSLASYLKEHYGGLDLLVNNAAIAYKVSHGNSETLISKIWKFW